MDVSISHNRGKIVYTTKKTSRMNLKNLPIKIQSLRGIEEAIVTSGGVELSEINPKTMESKLVRGLHFAGEIIDCDAYTGGFNLQIAWSTGYLAGISTKNTD